ncbi:MAG: hypothetical protein HY709_11595 [Candidatus Latescibacteria bacterium]|nr:hypothetical protein [Candidatus Latescibacterota bacterium]
MITPRRSWLREGMTLVFVSLLISQAEGFTYDVVPLDTIAHRADVVVVGSVVDLTTSELIFTYVQFAVSEILKGHIAEQPLTIKVLGGQPDINYASWDYSPIFTLGEETLIFLRWCGWCANEQVLAPAEGFQGKFTFQADTVVENGQPRHVFLTSVREAITRSTNSSPPNVTAVVPSRWGWIKARHVHGQSR